MNLVRAAAKYAGEALIMFVLIFSINNYFRIDKAPLIKADGKGYYDYLPAMFIYHDLPAYPSTAGELARVSERINTTDFYVKYKGSRVNKYPCGTALLLFPAFAVTHYFIPKGTEPADGFSLPYQESVYDAALIYVFLALIFLRKLLSLYNIRRATIFFVQAVTVFSTGIINYVYSEPAFSHVYSFFAITTFLYFVRSFFLFKKRSDFLWACFFIGLIVILRQVNIMVILLVPFLAGSWADLKSIFRELLQSWKTSLAGTLIMVTVVSIQLFLWHYQTGSWFVYSYQGESFDFLHPHFFDILFSYRKGLFVYTPALIFFVAGIVYWLRNGKLYISVAWLFFFTMLTYVLSSWYSWYYGMSYGLRAYIDWYAVFAIPISIGLDNYGKKTAVLLGLLIALTVPLNFIQTNQYKRYILHWDQMDKQKYWDVFLRTQERFQMYLWKPQFKTGEKIYEKKLGSVSVDPGGLKQIIAEESHDLANARYAELSFENTFSADENAHVEFFMENAANMNANLAQGTFLIHFAEKGLNKLQEGSFFYEIRSSSCSEPQKIYFKIVADKTPVRLDKIRLRIFR